MIPILPCVCNFFPYYYTVYSKHESNLQVTQGKGSLTEITLTGWGKPAFRHESFSKEEMK